MAQRMHPPALHRGGSSSSAETEGSRPGLPRQAAHLTETLCTDTRVARHSVGMLHAAAGASAARSHAIGASAARSNGDVSIAGSADRLTSTAVGACASRAPARSDGMLQPPQPPSADVLQSSLTSFQVHVHASPLLPAWPASTVSPVTATV